MFYSTVKLGGNTLNLLINLVSVSRSNLKPCFNLRKANSILQIVPSVYRGDNGLLNIFNEKVELITDFESTVNQVS